MAAYLSGEAPSGLLKRPCGITPGDVAERPHDQIATTTGCSLPIFATAF